MILNVSGRTDIVAFYSKWFMNRYREGFLDVRNPFQPKLVSRIYFENVDAILFCTKNPIPILKDISEIQKPILFHITLTPYQKDIEPNVPPKGQIIEAIKKISSIIGKKYVYVRYDPIFLSEKYDINYHIKSFEHLCTLLDGFVEHIIISFLDDYKNVQKNKAVLKNKPFLESDYEAIGKNFRAIAHGHNMTIQTCCEKKNLVEYGFERKECLSHTLAFQLTGKTNFKTWKVRGNNCKCVEMVDVGVYNTCSHFCKYCYANYNEKQVEENRKNHIDTSSLLIGELKDDDVIKIRK